MRLDVMFPYGLERFLATCAARPPIYESICQELYYLDEVSGCIDESDFRDVPRASLKTACSFASVRTSDDLERWAWAAIMHRASGDVRGLKHIRDDPRRSSCPAMMLVGLSRKKM